MVADWARIYSGVKFIFSASHTYLVVLNFDNLDMNIDSL